jgi:hypothetical protein
LPTAAVASSVFTLTADAATAHDAPAGEAENKARNLSIAGF